MVWRLVSPLAPWQVSRSDSFTLRSSGRETREMIRRKAEDVVQTVKEKAQCVTSGGRVGRGKAGSEAESE